MRITVTVAATTREGAVRQRDVRVTAPEGTRLSAVRTELAAAVDAGWSQPLYGTGGILSDDILLGCAEVRHGSRLWFGGPPADPPPGVLLVDVVGGPLAGRAFPLPAAGATIGRAAHCTIPLPDPDISREHAVLEVQAGVVSIRDCGSTNGTLVNGRPTGRRPARLRLGDLVEMGETVLTLSSGGGSAGPPAAMVGGRRRFRRAPRLAAAALSASIEMPDDQPGTATAIQWLPAIVPALGGAAVAWLTHNLTFLAFALLSPLVVLTQAVSDRITGRRRRRRSARATAAGQAAARRRAAELMAEEAARRHRSFPDPARCARTAGSADSRLWERSADDPDALQLRIGLGEVPSAVSVRRAGRTEPADTLRLVPVTVDLARGPVGVLGPPPVAAAVGRWLLGQLAVGLAPSQLRVIVLTADILSGSTDGPWAFTRWLPHRRADDAFRRAEVTAALDELLTETRAAARQPAQRPWTVLLLDRESAALPAVTGLLELEPAARVTAIGIGANLCDLPAACTTLAEVAGETPTRIVVTQPPAAGRGPALADQVADHWADQVARALAWTDDAACPSKSAAPDSVRLLDLLELNDPTPDQLIARWSATRSACVALAASARGPVAVDLAGDGPHALVAGTTGSGKSELLQSLIAGLAATTSPVDLTFVLIDYKGGAAFGDCAGLPHTVAVATDLDAHLTQRALVSFEAELRRREAVLARAGAASIEALHARASSTLLPRLVIVVDEFAALAQELPDFIPGLVSIAQRGRSLGLHLVLATQRPGGVVSPEIRANTALRIGLRMTDPGDSVDVVGTDAAARLSRTVPGRAIIRAGTSTTEVQTARISGPAPATSEDVRVDILDAAGRPITAAPDSGGKTDLQLLVAAAREAAARLGCLAPVSPWLPSLPTTLPVRVDARGALRLGVVDLPAEQAQTDLLFEACDGDPLLLVGGTGSGKTMALRAIAATCAATRSPDDLHLYVLDFAGGLRDLERLPHTGAVLGLEDLSTVAALLEHLGDLAGDRMRTAGTSGSAIDRMRTVGSTMLLLDGWDSFAAASEQLDGGRCLDLVYGLLRDGRAGGITTVIAGGRGALAGQLPRLVERKIALRLADRADYALAGLPARSAPTSLPPGRGVLWGSGAEIQLGCAGGDPSEDGQQLALAAAAQAWPPPVRPPARFRPLPRRITRADLPAGPDVILGVGGPCAVPVTVGLDTPGAHLLVVGPPRSGRSTTLATVLTQVAGRRTCAVVAGARSPLRQAATGLGVRMLSTADELPADLTGALMLIDDGDSLSDTPLGDRLAERLRGSPDGLSVILAARIDDVAVSYRGLLFELRRTGRVVLLNPAAGDGDAVGMRLPRQRVAGPPGRGYAALGELLSAGPVEEPFAIQMLSG